MASSQHLKRHSMPVAWPIKRKNITFIAKPNPGSHKLNYVVPVVVLLRDVLGHAQTAKEAKLILHTSEVLVNGKKVTDSKSPVGLFDLFEIKDSNEKYTVVFDTFGKVKLVSSKDDSVYLKVVGKTILPKGKTQINCMNGFNIIVDEKVAKSLKVRDTLVYDVSKKKVISTQSLKEGAFVYVFDGKYVGSFGEIKSFENFNGIAKDLISIEMDGVIHSTAKDYCYVIGSSKKDIERFA